MDEFNIVFVILCQRINLSQSSWNSRIWKDKHANHIFF